MKQVLSLLLILALVLSIGCTALAASANDYVDVPANAWFHDAVDYVVQRGYMVGATSDRFNPYGALTRAQICQVLYAMNGKPTAGTSPRFSDVTSDAWYSAAINWCATFGAVTGYPNGSFHPMEYVTREQLAMVLYKYSQLKGYAAEGEGGAMGIAGYADAADVGSWAYEAMSWCVAKGILTGSNIGLEPKKHGTRAEIAAILMSYDLKVAKA